MLISVSDRIYAVSQVIKRSALNLARLIPEVGSWKLEHAVTQRNHYGCSYSLLSAKGGRTGAIKGTPCAHVHLEQKHHELLHVLPCVTMCEYVFNSQSTKELGGEDMV